MQAIWEVIQTNIVPLLLAQVPVVLIALWAWWKSHAAQSAAQWDDKSVQWIEQVAKAVMEKQSPPPPPPAE